MTSPYDIGEVTVWVKDANAETGAFEWTMPWRIEKRLIPLRSLMALSGGGDASFRLLRRYRNDDGVDLYDTGAVIGAYIAITPDGDPPTDDDPDDTENALWFGFIASRDFAAMSVDEANQPNPDEIGTVTARGLGDLMDRVLIAGFRQQAADGNVLGAELLTTPIANPGIAGGRPVGNRTAVTLDGADFSLFTRLPADMALSDAVAGTGFWTRRRLLDHILRWCRPAGVPVMTLNAVTAAVLTDLEADERVTWDLSRLTLRGALDLLMPRTRGLVWSIWPRATTWRIYVDSLASVTTTYLHANTARTVDAHDCDLADVQLGDEIAYDQVKIRGARHVFGFTVAEADSNAERGWTAAQQTSFLAGASKHQDGTSNAAGYAALTNTQKLQANRELRQGILGDVFTRFLVKFNATGYLKHKGATSGTGAGTDRNAFPALTWDGSTVTVTSGSSDANNRVPYLPTALLLRTIPWQEGKASGSTATSDLRGTEAKLRPRYSAPKVFRYVSADTHKWTDLLAVGDGIPGPQLDVDDRAASLRVTYTPPELLAKGSWTTASPVPITPYSVNPDADSAASDYTKLVFTIAMEADQRLEVSQLRSGVTAAAVRRPLVLDDDDLGFWMMHAGTVVGVLPSRQPDRLASDEIVRSDYPAAQAWCEQSAAFALVTRVPAVITLAHPDIRHEWAEVGELIDEVIERSPANGDQEGRELYRRTLNTTVESVERNYAAEDGEHPRCIVRTIVAEVPTRMGASVSPAGGGAVSQVLKGTPAQATQAVASQAKRVVRDQQRPVVVPPRPALGTSRRYALQIIGGNLLSDGITEGIVYEAGGVTDVPSLYDPTVDSSFVDGIGRAILYINDVAQADYVLVAHYSGNGSSRMRALYADQVVPTSADTITLPLSGDPSQTVSLYLPG